MLLALAACGGGKEAAAPAPTTPGARGEPYKIAFTADVTGPASQSFGPVLEGFRLYVNYINARGGIAGHPIQLVAADNRSDPTTAAAQVRRFIEQDRVIMVMHAAPSVTIKPTTDLTKAARVPWMTVEVGCPADALPPQPDKYVFCLLADPAVDNRTYVQFIADFARQTGIRPTVVGVAADVPVSRAGVDVGAQRARELGLELVDQIAIPLANPDFTAIASRIISRGANFVWGWGPWDQTGGPLIEALRRQGWQGYYVAPGLAVSESEGLRLRDPRIYIPRWFAMSYEPPASTLREAHAQFGSPFPPDRLIGGWVAGIIVTTALERCGWPCDGPKLASSLESGPIDTGGLLRLPVTYSATDHVGGKALYLIYNWDERAQSLVVIKEVAGQ
jgi:ABC-type branched-subunit amino acid transport system substrate-binding protein